MGAHHDYTQEQLDFLEQNYMTMQRKELAEAFNKKFGTDYAKTTITCLCNRHGWRSPIDGRFTSETSPRWQKGLDKDEFKSHYTEESLDRMTKPMIEGNRVHHIGDTVIWHNIPYVVIDETPNKPWSDRLMNKGRYVYEQAYGKLTDQDLIIHLDDDEMNCDLDNLALVKQSWRAEFIHNGWWHASAELKLAAIEYCKLKDAIKEAIA